MFEDFRRLAHWCAVLTMVSVVTGCGGGGGDGGSPPQAPHSTPPSKVFVGDAGSIPPAAPTAAAIGSSPNSNPPPGPIAVERIVQGPSTLLTASLKDFALDTAGDRLYVSDGRTILVFDNISTATGNIAPRVVSNCCGGPTGSGNFVGIYLDTLNDRLYAGVNINISPAAGQEIHVFHNVSSASSSPPTRTILVNPRFLIDVAVDPTKNILYVYGLNATTVHTEIAVFDSAATLIGTATQNRTITIGESFSSGPGVGMFIDPANDRLYAPRLGQVMVFDIASTKDGDVSTTAAPARTIMLPVPAMTNITVELTANRLYALDGDGLSIIPNASTVNGTPPVVTRVLAPSGSTFKAVAVSP